MSKNKKKHVKTNEAAQQDKPLVIDSKTVTRVVAIVLASLMVLGTITMTIMYLIGG